MLIPQISFTLQEPLQMLEAKEDNHNLLTDFEQEKQVYLMMYFRISTSCKERTYFDAISYL